MRSTRPPRSKRGLPERLCSSVIAPVHGMQNINTATAQVDAQPQARKALTTPRIPLPKAWFRQQNWRALAGASQTSGSHHVSQFELNRAAQIIAVPGEA